MSLKAPFPYFGGKRRAAPLVWERFGPVRNYVEPFFGSGAVLLQRPEGFEGSETVNDADGLICNFWRALQHDPDQTAFHADNPVNECDLHARHAWLVNRKDSLQARLEGDPDYFDPKVAGWWAWGISCWIGSGWCSGNGPWHAVDGELTKTGEPGGTWHQLPHLSRGQGVKRQRPHLGNAGQGVNRQRPHLGDAGNGVNRQRQDIGAYFAALAGRLRGVRVCCGDWARVTGPTVLRHAGAPCGVFLDPPYADTAGRDNALYRLEDSQVAHRVRGWAISVGDDPDVRIALCGYEGEHEMPGDWAEVVGKSSQGGYGGQAKAGYANAGRERIWFSPHCLKPERSRTPLLDLCGAPA